MKSFSIKYLQNITLKLVYEYFPAWTRKESVEKSDNKEEKQCQLKRI